MTKWEFKALKSGFYGVAKFALLDLAQSKTGLGPTPVREVHKAEREHARKQRRLLIKKYRARAALGLETESDTDRPSRLDLEREIALLSRLINGPRRRPGPAGWPEPLAVHLIRALELFKRDEPSLNQIRSFLQPGGEFEAWLKKTYLPSDKEGSLPISLYALNKDKEISTKWANDLKRNVLKGLTHSKDPDAPFVFPKGELLKLIRVQGKKRLLEELPDVHSPATANGES